jgi:hypothetical protein
MKSIILIIGFLFSSVVFAHGFHGGHEGGHVFHSGPVFIPHPFYVPPPIIYVPPPIYIPEPDPVYIPAPPVYVPPPAPTYIPETRTWFYCRSSNQYYPTVPTCPEGWEQVHSIR